MELLKKLYEIHSPSQGERKLKRFIKKWVKQNVENVKIECENRNIYLTKGEADDYPCIVAHLDQVQTRHSEDFKAVETEDIIFGWSQKNRRQEGLGADDKNGIWIALNCLLNFDNMKVALFYGEEIGCLGSSRANMDFFNNVRFVIEPDRRGAFDLITQIGGVDLCSDEFIEQIVPENYGYSPTCGAMTDVEELKTSGLSVSCINLSCGYYSPHTDEEVTVKEDLYNCLYFVESIIMSVEEKSEHEYTYSYGRYKSGKGSSYTNWREYDADYYWWKNYEDVSDKASKAKTKSTSAFPGYYNMFEDDEDEPQDENDPQLQMQIADIESLADGFTPFEDIWDYYSTYFDEKNKEILRKKYEEAQKGEIQKWGEPEEKAN